MISRALVLAFGALMLLSSCIGVGSQATLPSAPKTVSMPLPKAKLSPYHIQVGDVLDIKFLLNPELNEQVIVRPDGLISTTVAEDVMAYGRTVKEVKSELVNAYRSQLNKPKLAVVVRSFAPNRVYVTGEVVSPGEFITVGPNLTLLQAISRAGGLKNSAGADKIVILRRGAGDEPEAYSTDYNAAASGKDPKSDIRLAAYDVVYVPRSDVGDVYLHYQQYIQEFIPASFGMSYQLNKNSSATSR